jgi:copper resistance protein D
MQMTANPNYEGLLRLGNGWAWVILLKHIAVAGMVGIGVWQQWGLQPELARLALLEARDHPANQADALRRRELTLTRLNLGCGVLVLAFTALARVL